MWTRRFAAWLARNARRHCEEVLFHWANKDQHYVKTAEAFRDYALTVEALGGPYRVRFVLTAARVPSGNVKGDTRSFFPLPAGETIIDFFAGSGTTGHAVINLNREDGENRRFILVEMENLESTQFSNEMTTDYTDGTDYTD